MHTQGQHGFGLPPGEQVPSGVAWVMILEPEALAAGHTVTVKNLPHLPTGRVRCARAIRHCIHEPPPLRAPAYTGQGLAARRLTMLASLLPTVLYRRHTTVRNCIHAYRDDRWWLCR